MIPLDMMGISDLWKTLYGAAVKYSELTVVAISTTQSISILAGAGLFKA